ncbi:MAG: DUF481 domain-containing protein [Campylobacterota bacterium]|nr:DUF481 domain-containing protein [Campylobacterota bacterium]
MKKIVLSALVASSLVMANEPDLVKDDALVTHTEFGYIETQGNTVTKVYNLDAKVKKGWGRHIFELTFDGQYASDKNIETKNKYLAELEYDYEISDRFALDYLTGYKRDKFSGYRYQFYTGPGAKYKAIVTEAHNLSVEGNVLYSRDSVEDIHYDAAGDIIAYPNPAGIATASTLKGKAKDYTSYRVKGVYGWQMLENLKFDQELSYRAEFKDSDIYFVYSKTAFSSKISDIFSAGISYKVDYVNTPPEGKEYTDRTFTANLIIDY